MGGGGRLGVCRGGGRGSVEADPLEHREVSLFKHRDGDTQTLTYMQGTC